MKKSFPKQAALILSAAMLLALCTACGGSGGGTPGAAESPASTTPAATESSTATYTFTYATVDAQGSSHDQMVEQKLKSLLEEKSDGRMTLDIYYSASLTGISSTLDGVLSGTVDMGYDACTSYAGKYPYAELFNTPGVNLGDRAHATSVLLDYYKQFPDAELENVKIVARFCGNTFGIFAQSPIYAPSDMKGLSFRSTGDKVAFAEACGATAISLPSSEVYEALRLSVINGSFASGTSLVTFNYGEVTKSFTPLNIMNGDSIIVMNKALYDSMSASDQAIMDEIFTEMQQVMIDYVNYAEEEYKSETAQAFPEFQFVELSPEQLQAFVDIGTPLLKTKAAELDGLGLKGTEAMNWLMKQNVQ